MVLLHVVQLGWFPTMVQAVHASIDVHTGSHCTVAAGACVHWGMHGVESGPGFRPSAITMPAMPAATLNFLPPSLLSPLQLLAPWLLWQHCDGSGSMARHTHCP